eukprot:1502519-Pleurochrysis_carterae.AAC.1
MDGTARRCPSRRPWRPQPAWLALFLRSAGASLAARLRMTSRATYRAGLLVVVSFSVSCSHKYMYRILPQLDTSSSHVTRCAPPHNQRAHAPGDACDSAVHRDSGREQQTPPQQRGGGQSQIACALRQIRANERTVVFSLT